MLETRLAFERQHAFRCSIRERPEPLTTTCREQHRFHGESDLRSGLVSMLTKKSDRGLQAFRQRNFWRPVQFQFCLFNLQITVVNFARTLGSVDWLKRLN